MKYVNWFIGLLLFGILASSINAQSADTILEEHFNAINQEKLSSVKALKMQATMSMMGSEMPMSLVQKRPDKIRTEVEMQGMKMITIYNGVDGWMINPMMGSNEPQKIPDDQLGKLLSESSLFDSELHNYEEKGHTIVKLDDGDADGKSAYVIQLTHKNGQILKYYFDKSNYLITKTTATVNNRGMEMEVESLNKDYKKINDIMFAHTIEVNSNGQLFQKTIVTNIELNIDIEDSIFEKSSLAK